MTGYGKLATVLWAPIAHRLALFCRPALVRGASPTMEVCSVTDSEPSQWYDHLSDTERHECAADLTDAYFSALSADNWPEFQALMRQWLVRAEEKQPVAV
jgi:hypothetical protein